MNRTWIRVLLFFAAIFGVGGFCGGCMWLIFGSTIMTSIGAAYGACAVVAIVTLIGCFGCGKQEDEMAERLE